MNLYSMIAIANNFRSKNTHLVDSTVVRMRAQYVSSFKSSVLYRHNLQFNLIGFKRAKNPKLNTKLRKLR